MPTFYANSPQYPHLVQQVMSKEKTPVLAGVIPTFEQFMTAWESLAIKNPHLSDALNLGLSFATKYYNKMDATKAYIIAMCECQRSHILVIPYEAHYSSTSHSSRYSFKLD
jgi:hypothetical protein